MPTLRARHIMLVAGEYSGSLYGAVVARRLRELGPDLRLTGVGGHHLEEAGVELLCDSSTWGGIGLVEAIKRSPVLVWAYFKLRRFIENERPDLLILIDYPGFNMLLARAAKRLGIPTLYYFPPGKYRSDPQDVLDAARTITRVAAPLEVTYEKYQALDARVDFVGHPLLDVLPDVVDIQGTRTQLGVAPDEQIIGLLPGSRLAEIEYHTPLLCRAAAILSQRVGKLRFFVPVVASRDGRLQERIHSLVSSEISRVSAPIQVLDEQAHKIMAVSKLVLVASGTATLEAAYYGTPMVIIYRTSKLTEMLAPFFHSLPFKFVGLPNILADRQIVPELLQERFTVDNVVSEAMDILTNADRDLWIRNELKGLLPMMGPKGASDRVARMALEMIPSWNPASS